MQRQKGLDIFFVFLFLSLIVFALSRTNIVSPFRSMIETMIAPIAGTVYGIIGRLQPANSQIDKLKKENEELREKLINIKKLEEDVKALSDQFQTTTPRSQDLLPAKVIGSQPESIIIDKGISDGVKEGMAAVVKNNLIGKIVRSSHKRSLIYLITHPNSSFAAKTISKNGGVSSLGVVKGQSEEQMTLTNVLLSEELNISDIVVTKGDLDLNGIGIPTDLMIGEIVSIDKKPSALFQTASLKSSLDFSRLIMVFVVTQ